MSKAGASAVGSAGTITEIGGGWYAYQPTSTETNTIGDFILIPTVASGYSPGRVAQVVAYNAGDANLGLNLDMSNFTAQWKALNTRARIQITGGTANPATNDYYTTTGLYLGGVTAVPYYTSSTLGTTIYLWTDGTGGANEWYITTTTPGNFPSSGTSYWQTAAAAGVTGTYTVVANGGTGSGTPAVAMTGTSILDSLQPASASLTLGANVVQVAGATASASGSVAFPTSIGTSTFAAGQNVNVNTVTAGVVAADVLNAKAGSYNTALTIGAKINSAGSSANPFSTLISGGGFTLNDGTFGGLILNETALKTSGATTPSWWVSPTGAAVGSVTGAVGSVTGSVGSVTGAVGSVTGPVTVGTINSGTTAPAGFFANGSAPASGWFANAAAGSDPWLTALPGTYGAGSAGNILGTIVQNALKTSGATAPSWYTAPLLDGNGYVKSNIFAINTGVTAPGGFLTNEYTAIANQVLATPVDTTGSTITLKQANEISAAIQAGKFSVTYVSGTRTQTTVYYKADGVTTLVTSVVVFDTTGRAVSKTMTFSNL